MSNTNSKVYYDISREKERKGHKVLCERSLLLQEVFVKLTLVKIKTQVIFDYKKHAVSSGGRKRTNKKVKTDKQKSGGKEAETRKRRHIHRLESAVFRELTNS